jgi:hypothetical protein
MPLCPQITNTPITVTQTADFTVSSVLPVVAATTTQVDAVQVTADNAYTDAVAAAAAAASASAIASTAIQKSANTIVNGSNQLTAINGTGITVYSGGSATSGARVVLNSAGLAGYNSGGTATFAIESSTGNVSMAGALLSGGSITGTSINVPTAGSPAFSVNALGAVTATNMTINGGQIYLNGGVFSVSALGALTATNANITGTITATGGTISGALTVSGSLTGGTIQTSSGSNAVVLDGANNALGIKYGGTYAGWLVGIGSGAFMMHYGTSPSVTGYPRTSVSGTTASLAADGSNSISITTSGNNMQGNMTFGGSTNTFTNSLVANGTITYPGIATGSGSPMVVVTTGSRIAYSTSSERFKQDIVYINTPGWLDKVMAMKPITYKTSEDFIVEGEPNETQYGFLAEDIYDLGGGLEKAVVLDPLGEPFSLSYDRLTVFLTLAIKELKAEIDQLKGE